MRFKKPLQNVLQIKIKMGFISNTCILIYFLYVRCCLYMYFINKFLTKSLLKINIPPYVCITGRYLYIGDGSITTPGSHADLLGPSMPATSSSGACVRFWFIISGTIGSLEGLVIQVNRFKILVLNFIKITIYICNVIGNWMFLLMLDMYRNFQSLDFES